MKRALTTLLMVCASWRAYAGDGADSTIWITNTTGLIDSGWVTSFPTGSSDYFNVAHTVQPGIGDSANVVEGLHVNGIAVAVADFGSDRTFEVVGIYNSNLSLDATGSTPNLASPLTSKKNPKMDPPPPLFNYAAFTLPQATIPAGTTRVHAVAQYPPGDSGLLGVGADSTTAHPGVATSGFTTDGYATPALMGSFFDFGLNPGQDNSTTTSCRPVDRRPHGRLRVRVPGQGIGEGDRLTTTIQLGERIELAFFGADAGTHGGDVWRVYASGGWCSPLIGLGPALPTLADPDGTGSYSRVSTPWPFGYGGRTFQFSALWGNPGCSSPGVGFTNCVTVISEPDPAWGICDDGRIESGWVVQIPSGSSDYFNNSYGVPPPSVNGVVGLTLAVLDFGTAVPEFPAAGVSNANLLVDPTGNTPDVVNPLACVCPFTFPPLTFATTSAQYVTHAVSIPRSALGTNVNAWVQFPPGDSGLLGIGGDTSSGSNQCSFFSLDGYTSPAISLFVNWGLRIKTN